MGAKIWTAKFITGPIQAQCYSSGGVFSSRSRYQWNRRGARTVCSSAPVIGLFRSVSDCHWARNRV